MKIRNVPSPIGRRVGAELARLIEPSIRALAAQGEPDERCTTCAFRAGTFPNGCSVTVMDAIKCGLEGEPFYCHDKSRPQQTCHGWFAMRHEYCGNELQVPWEFSE